VKDQEKKDQNEASINRIGYKRVLNYINRGERREDIFLMQEEEGCGGMWKKNLKTMEK
jgi:hypothetical protein